MCLTYTDELYYLQNRKHVMGNLHHRVVLLDTPLYVQLYRDLLPPSSSRRHGPLRPQVLLVLHVLHIIARQLHRAVQRDGQPAVPASQHHEHEHELRPRVQPAREAEVVPRHAEANADAAVRGDDLEPFNDGPGITKSGFLGMIQNSPLSKPRGMR
ncbi:uncharacterized protein B0I36DRAFT_134745 [Microdochium trichocladiopsis]|uniref:Uncharacterized protein n=1 Tax=Microdochium trichocladiopsis TaxID=1682393 RepID=A0A9P8Y5F6_9PEZI|nr:uncharacterized protein B0I36DRAFT_134745 [Microdochium trichocladiopsis]KAH7029660.1 hypothetical protein B0I36DRAFT_134745 [Microdochium trichocladiopsis]